LRWFFVALCGFAASLSKFTDEWITEPPPLVFPLEQLREAGRPLAIVLLGLLLLLAFRSRNGWRFSFTPNPVPYLVLVQVFVVVKTLLYGNVGFALLSAMTFGAVVWVVIQGPSRWLQDERNFRLGVCAIAMVSVIFIIVNTYQAKIDPYPITFVHGQFLGTTGNPQHAAVLLATAVPCFLFLVAHPTGPNWIRRLWGVILVPIALGLFLTGSRTGAISAVIGILVFYRRRGGTILRLGLGAAILAISFSYLSSDFGSNLGVLDFSASVNKLSSVNDTRTQVWQSMWHSFSENPLFGAPLEGDRLGYGENSWLATGATVGLLGFIPLVMFGIECLKTIYRLDKIANRKPNLYYHCSVVIAGLSSLLIGSVAEAYLLGNITFSMLALLLYLVLGNYLLDVDRRETQMEKGEWQTPNMIFSEGFSRE
jgi:O-antigen ligase